MATCLVIGVVVWVEMSNNDLPQQQPEESALCSSLATEIGRLPLRATTTKESELLALNRVVAEHCPHLVDELKSVLETMVAAAEHEFHTQVEEFQLLKERMDREEQVREEWLRERNE